MGIDRGCAAALPGLPIYRTPQITISPRRAVAVIKVLNNGQKELAPINYLTLPVMRA